MRKQDQTQDDFPNSNMYKKNPILPIVVCCAIFFAANLFVAAQTDDETTKATAMAVLLFQQEHYAEAAPYFATVVKATPNDGKLRFLYGWCLLAKSKQITDTAEAKQLSAQALEQFKEAKKLGLVEKANDSLIAILSGEAGSEDPLQPSYSKIPDAEKAMNDGENLFAQSKYEEAVKFFEKALALDPTIYQAATSGGDCYTSMGDWANAEKWYQKGIAIDPNRETAYRYSATPLMKQKKYDQARDRYIEAYIVEPYNAMSARGINQWGSITGTKLKHPEVSVPEFTFDDAGKAVPKVKIDQTDKNNAPWLAYFSARELWKKEKFRTSLPKAGAYRHSLAEEIESLRAAVAEAVRAGSKNEQFETLAKMDKDGVLEAYVLLALPDDGIAEDFPEYLKNNRAKLRQYVANYVIRK